MGVGPVHKTLSSYELRIAYKLGLFKTNQAGRPVSTIRFDVVERDDLES